MTKTKTKTKTKIDAKWVQDHFNELEVGVSVVNAAIDQLNAKLARFEKAGAWRHMADDDGRRFTSFYDFQVNGLHIPASLVK